MNLRFSILQAPSPQCRQPVTGEDCVHRHNARLFNTLVPKLRLGTRLRAKLCFAWKECLRAGSHRTRPQDTPAWETEFPSQVRSQTEFENESVNVGYVSSGVLGLVRALWRRKLASRGGIVEQAFLPAKSNDTPSTLRAGWKACFHSPPAAADKSAPPQSADKSAQSKAIMPRSAARSGSRMRRSRFAVCGFHPAVPQRKRR